MWTRWNVGDTREHIPPLRILKKEDWEFLDLVPKSDQAKRGSTGKYKDNKRPARKTFSDIKSLCKIIEAEAKRLGMDVNDKTLANVNRIYHRVEPTIYEGSKTGERETQLKWTTVLNKLREKGKEERKAKRAAAKAASAAAARELMEQAEENDREIAAVIGRADQILAQDDDDDDDDDDEEEEEEEEEDEEGVAVSEADIATAKAAIEAGVHSGSSDDDDDSNDKA